MKEGKREFICPLDLSLLSDWRMCREIAPSYGIVVQEDRALEPGLEFDPEYIEFKEVYDREKEEKKGVVELNLICPP